jgi:hypothetical protein
MPKTHNPSRDPDGLGYWVGTETPGRSVTIPNKIFLRGEGVDRLLAREKIKVRFVKNDPQRVTYKRMMTDR